MTMNNDPWKKLAAAAQSAPSEEGGANASAPFGFSTRAVALWKEEQVQSRSRERFAWGALGVSCAIAALCFVLNYDSVRELRDNRLDLASLEQTEEIL